MNYPSLFSLPYLSFLIAPVKNLASTICHLPASLPFHFLCMIMSGWLNIPLRTITLSQNGMGAGSLTFHFVDYSFSKLLFRTSSLTHIPLVRIVSDTCNTVKIVLLHSTFHLGDSPSFPLSKFFKIASSLKLIFLWCKFYGLWQMHSVLYPSLSDKIVSLFREYLLCFSPPPVNSWLSLGCYCLCTVTAFPECI